MAAKDYYGILGVNRNASADDIKKAYKNLAKKYHPDLNKDANATEKFKEINEAASVLGDEKKRAQYDRHGTTTEGFGAGEAGFDFRDFSNFSEFGFDFDTIFDRFFSGGRGRRRTARGTDLRYDFEITLEEAAKGVKKTINIEKHEKCRECNGTGADESSDIIKCGSCNGTGFERQTRRMPFGIFTTSSICSKCNGHGTYIRNPCKKCHGNGRVQRAKKLEIAIPSGIEDGSRLRIAGEGEAGEKGAPSGDLYMFISVRQHKIFERDGDDLSIEIPISFAQAALGAEIEVPTLEGKAKLKIPAGTQTGTIFRMKGKGMPDMETGHTGAENVKVMVEIPQKLTSKQKKLLEEFEKEERKGFGLF